MTEEHPDTQGDEHRLFERISRERFDALALWGMPQQMREDIRRRPPTTSCAATMAGRPG
jgi:hypothetical protein